jgi:hypothetical protein
MSNSMSNMDLWHSVCVTDPKAVKPITGKQYKGDSPKPYWIIQRATEAFGPCGFGWGIEVVNERFERFGDAESLHIALVRVWYMKDDKRCVIEQMGQTRSSYLTSAGKFLVDEDAPKKSVTDGMVKCLSMLGFAGDIFSGQWNDSRYVQWASEETERREHPPELPVDMSPPARAARITAGVANGDAVAAAAALVAMPEEVMNAILALLNNETHDKVTAAWPA